VIKSARKGVLNTQGDSITFREQLRHFAENFSCKYSAEIQSVHFGSSHRQATMHDGVFYVVKDQSLTGTCFCSISDCMQHDPVVIWS